MSHLHRQLAAGFIAQSSIMTTNTITRYQSTGSGTVKSEETRSSLEWLELPGKKRAGSKPGINNALHPEIKLRMGPAHLSVYMALALHTKTPLDEEELVSTASIPMLTQTCGWSMRQISALLNDLLIVGWISRLSRGGKTSSQTTIYRSPDPNRAVGQANKSESEEECQPPGTDKRPETPLQLQKVIPASISQSTISAALSEMLTDLVGRPIIFGHVQSGLKNNENLLPGVRAFILEDADPTIAKFVRNADDPARALASKLASICERESQHRSWIAFVEPYIEQFLTGLPQEEESPELILGEFFAQVTDGHREGLPYLQDNPGFAEMCLAFRDVMEIWGAVPTIALCKRSFTGRDNQWRKKLILAQNPGTELKAHFEAMRAAFPDASDDSAKVIHKPKAEGVTFSDSSHAGPDHVFGANESESDDDDEPVMDDDPDEMFEREWERREAARYGD